MSRIILDRHSDGSRHVVVGWDHPCGGAFWQEYGTKAEVAEAEKSLSGNVDEGSMTYEEALQLETLAEVGIKRQGGFGKGLPLPLTPQMPEELQPLMSDYVEQLLVKHAADPDSGYDRSKSNVDLTV